MSKQALTESISVQQRESIGRSLHAMASISILLKFLSNALTECDFNHNNKPLTYRIQLEYKTNIILLCHDLHGIQYHIPIMMWH